MTASEETAMATRVKPAKTLYEEDLYVWSQTQAALLRAGRFDELDLANLIEEIEDVGGALRRSVQKRTITIMVHLLKLEHSPASDPRVGWRDTIRTQRTRLLTDLTPALRRLLAADLADLYARARHDADGSLRDHGEQGAADALPPACAYTLDQITGDWLP
jgi:uncharacterized protein DUF29